MSAGRATRPSSGRIAGGLLAAGALFGLGIFLLGLPGMAVIELVAPLMGPRALAAFKGDKAWPAGIVVTQVMPLGVIVSAAVLARVKADAGIGASMAWGLLGYVAAGVVAVIVLVSIE